VSGEQPIPFGGTSVLATARRGDRLSFYEWPSQDMIMPRLKASAEGGARVEHLQALVAAPALAAAASALEKSLIGVWPAPGGEVNFTPGGEVNFINKLKFLMKSSKLSTFIYISTYAPPVCFISGSL
jgi:hypothetical protein